MAIFQPSALISAVSGRIGGVEFSKGRAGSVVKSKRRNRLTLSERQTAATSILSSFTYWWNAATTETRNAWATYAKIVPVKNRFNQAITMTARAHALRYHLHLYDWLDRILPPVVGLQPPLPVTFYTWTPLITSCTFTAGGTYELVLGSPFGLYTRTIMYAERSRHKNPGGPSNMRFIGALTYDGNPQDWYSKFTAAGCDWELQAGEWLHLGIRNMGHATLAWPSIAVNYNVQVV